MTDQLKESLRNAERRGGKASVARQIENWIADYHALEGVPDEFIDSDGVARQHWVRFFVALARYSQREIAQRFATADRLVRETGADDAGGASRRLDAVGAQTGRIGCAYRAVPSSSA